MDDENNAPDGAQRLDDDASILSRQSILMLPVTDMVIQALTRFWNAHTVDDLTSLLETWDQGGDAVVLVRFDPAAGACRVDIVSERLDVNDPPPPPGTGAYL